MQKLHALFVRTLAAVALTCGGLEEAGVHRVQTIYAGCMRGFLTRDDLAASAVFSSSVTAIDELCEEIAKARNRLDTRAGELLFEGALLLLSRTGAKVSEQARLLQSLAHSFDLSEETTEFLVARWDKMNLEEVLAARGVDLSVPVEPEVSVADEIANKTNTDKCNLSREEMVFYVRDSWEFASRHREQVAKQMYAHLLWTDESAAVLFIRTDMEQQSTLLTHMLEVAVSKLDVLDEITDTVRELGRRHVSYSIRPEHYSTVGASLLWALEQTQGPQRWTDKVEAAWKSVYTILMSVMLEGDQQARDGM